LPGRDFSFWKWFWANMNLVKNYVRKEWQEGYMQHQYYVSVSLSVFLPCAN